MVVAYAQLRGGSLTADSCGSVAFLVEAQTVALQQLLVQAPPHHWTRLHTPSAKSQ